MRVDLDDHTTEADDTAGSGQPVVFVHSALLDRHVWDTVTPLLGTRAITYDLRGHGAAAEAPPISGIPQLAADLDRLLDVLGVPAAHLVGFSFGGAVVQELAATGPRTLRRWNGPPRSPRLSARSSPPPDAAAPGAAVRLQVGHPAPMCTPVLI